MNILKRILGLNDKSQAMRTEAVSDYVHGKKSEFANDMIQLKKQAIVVRKKTMQAHRESIKLSKSVEDVVTKIAIATNRANI